MMIDKAERNLNRPGRPPKGLCPASGAAMITADEVSRDTVHAPDGRRRGTARIHSR